MLGPRVPSTGSSTIDQRVSSNPQARNPVSLRLYKILGTNFDDEATKGALQTLSDLYATSEAPKGKDVKRDAEYMDDEDDDTAAKSVVRVDNSLLIETLPGESAARARRNLRRDMENKLAEGSRQFLKAFGEVDQVCFCTIHTCFFVLFVRRN